MLGGSWEAIVLGEVVLTFALGGSVGFEEAEFVRCVSCRKVVGFAWE